MSDSSVPQPDSALVVLPEYGGRTTFAGMDGDDQFVHGGPELVGEVAYSSRSVDLHGKLRDYERAGVLEYLVVDLRRECSHWFALREGRFKPSPPDADGVFRSRVFTGFWIAAAPLIAKDPVAIARTLNQGLETPEHEQFVRRLEQRRTELARSLQ
jgi:Uma2 family endonuclease